MQPGHGRDLRRDDCSQRHCPPAGLPVHGTDPETTAYSPRPGSRSRRHIIGAHGRAPQGRLRRRLRRPGSARSLTCPAARHGDGSYQETGDASHARPKPARTPEKPTLTRLRSFRDDRERRRSHGPDVHVHLAAPERLRPGIPQSQRAPRPRCGSRRTAPACRLLLDLRPDPRQPRLVFRLPAPAWPPGPRRPPGRPPLLQRNVAGKPLTERRPAPSRHPSRQRTAHLERAPARQLGRPATAEREHSPRSNTRGCR